MNIITILGSPRKKGNTATVLKNFEHMITSRHNVERINIRDYTVAGCLGCNNCFKKPDEPGCIQKDDANHIFDRMIASDIIVYATPLYMWSFSAQIKPLMDRHYCLVKLDRGKVVNSLLEGKRAALLVTCGDPIENNADLIPIIFDREMKYQKCDVIGKYIVPNCTNPGQLGDKSVKTAHDMFDDISKL